MIWWLLFTLPAVIGSVEDPDCFEDLGEEGWRCVISGECVSLNELCDGFEQCGDDSDEGKAEGEGCNLYPASQCLSYHGKEHFKCEVAGRPTLCLPSLEEVESCKAATGRPDRTCEEDKWRCGDGRCIQSSQICDGHKDCDDGTDESKEPFNGCNLFNSSCPSWGGQEMMLCDGTESVCTIPELANQGNVSICRNCLGTDGNGNHIEGLWRCDNGKCINSTLRNNDVFDCEDGSDEDSPGIHNQWIAMLLTAIFVTLFGLGLSFLCRFLKVKNERSCFSCNLCSSSRKVPSDSKWKASYDALPKSSQGQNDAPDNITISPEHGQDRANDDSPNIPLDTIKLIKLIDDAFTAQENTDEGDSNIPALIREGKDAEVKSLYLNLHDDDDPIKYYHLYMYLANCAPTNRDLKQVSSILNHWEMEIHKLQKQDVHKCWRMKLGTSRLTAEIVESVSDTPTFCGRIDKYCSPVKNFIRQTRRRCLKSKKYQDHWLTEIGKTVYYLMSPFIQATLFYLEVIKQMMFAYILWKALNNLSKDNPTDHPFELGMFVSMIIMIVIVQILFAVYSFIFTEEIFEIQHEDSCNSKIIYLFRFLAAILGLIGIMPVYVIANHVHYKVKQNMLIRHLQTCQLEDNNDDTDNKDEERSGNSEQIERMIKYEEVHMCETKANLYGKIYNYYRSTSAVLGSVTLLVVWVLLKFVTGRDHREIKLNDGVNLQLHELLYSFIPSTTGATFFQELNYTQEVILYVALVTSLVAVVTAIVNYWNLANNLALSTSGEVFIGLYVACIVVNKLTTYTSIFAITQSIKFDAVVTEPTITLVPAIIIFCFLCVAQVIGVFLYKKFFSKGWNSGTYMDQWINVLINSLVVVPFMYQKDHLKILQQNEQEVLVKKRSFSLKKEYFWLFFMVFVENFVALIFEMVSGGLLTADGHYYSWDIRLGTFTVGLVCLRMYYKKYHLFRNLTYKEVCGDWLKNLPDCFCCPSDDQEPKEEDKERKSSPRDQLKEEARKEIETQTSASIQTPTLPSTQPPPSPTSEPPPLPTSQPPPLEEDEGVARTHSTYENVQEARNGIHNL